MSASSITKDIHAVGILNPAMRIFDVVMKTEYGTSYNSYIVKGAEKTALIETCHLTFFDQYLDNIRQVCDPAQIHYIILNHCEPDHSGVLARLTALCPKAQILVSQAGSLYLKNITNQPSLPITVAKDGDQVDLGGKTLQFISAPFLHWPDSMLTWCPEEKVLFPVTYWAPITVSPILLIPIWPILQNMKKLSKATTMRSLGRSRHMCRMV